MMSVVHISYLNFRFFKVFTLNIEVYRHLLNFGKPCSRWNHKNTNFKVFVNVLLCKRIFTFQNNFLLRINTNK